MNSISTNVYAHQIVNPPTAQSGSDINIVFNQDKNNIVLNKKGKSRHQTEYELSIKDPQQMGVTQTDQRSLSESLYKILLAFNLSLHRSALISQQQSESSFQIIPGTQETKSTVEDTPTGKKITIQETLTITDSVFITVGLSENINEKTIDSNYNLIKNLDNSNLQNQVHIENLKKALNEYNSAMCSFDRISIFKLLFNSLELAVNYDNAEKKGNDFDDKVVDLIGPTIEIKNIQTDSKNTITYWRQFYNQTKHPDTKISNLVKFWKKKEDITTILDPLRLITQKIILERLNKFNG